VLIRVAVTDILQVSASLGVLCWILPQTQEWARLWSDTFLGAVFTQLILMARI
jgi:hypothetical protein